MSDANAYTADTARIQGGIRQVHEISTAAQSMLRNFENRLKPTAGWPGEDDSFAKATKPHAQRENVTAAETMRAIVEAIVAIADGTSENVKNIRSTQAGNLDAILRSPGGNSTGTNGRKH
ncbi:hypothetical protein ACIA6T_20750 [Streptomyces sp. NPDC051740]|jgi:hypothetical protein|uniref:hypothetical protein n=1 Tax=unclassified Streptomyces TaxID=2593676 RepID=UPI0037BBD71F